MRIFTLIYCVSAVCSFASDTRPKSFSSSHTGAIQTDIKAVMRACTSEAKKTADLDTKNVCFTQKEAKCILLASSYLELSEKMNALQLKYEKDRCEAERKKDVALHATDLKQCKDHLVLLESRKCVPPAAPWISGSSAFVVGALVGGGLVGGICHANTAVRR